LSDREPLTKDPAEGLPEGSVLEGEIRIISYLDEDGDEMYAFSRTADLATSRVISLLEMTKIIVAHELVHSYDEEDEEE
jgi:hypothetical protein